MLAKSCRVPLCTGIRIEAFAEWQVVFNFLGYTLSVSKRYINCTSCRFTSYRVGITTSVVLNCPIDIRKRAACKGGELGVLPLDGFILNLITKRCKLGHVVRPNP